jgi:hypothetical protein
VLKHKVSKVRARQRKKSARAFPIWTSAGMALTFRAELMPGRDSSERTYVVWRMLASGRVELIGLSGQHTEAEFEPAR